jgi:hypothetical protein
MKGDRVVEHCGMFSIADVKTKIKALLCHWRRPLQNRGRAAAQLPPGGESVSVEKAMNSRCTSDTDGDPRENHWGMFDPTCKLSEATIHDLAARARIPRFTNLALGVSVKGNVLTIVSDAAAQGFQRECMMVEAGMQQQAILLECAALGIGVTIQNMGKDGTLLSSSKSATLKILVGPMKPSYDGSVWTTDAPDGLGGNLPQPTRDGAMPLLAALAAIDSLRHPGLPAYDRSVGQLLWAARGRTPHYYLSRPWGLTIPTWGGVQSLSTITLLSTAGAYRYDSDRGGAPMHSVLKIAGDSKPIRRLVSGACPDFNTFLVLSRTEFSGRALWEIGYALLNILLQAHALEIAYRVILLDQSQQTSFRGTEIQNAVAVVGIDLKGQIPIA